MGIVLLAAACSGETAVDAGGVDAGGPDAGHDAGHDAAVAPRDANVMLPDARVGVDAGTDAGVDGGTHTVASCFEGVFADPTLMGPDYDVFGPRVGSHCLGTDHQAIRGVERVVFLGDSVTVGTPPTGSADFYRTRLARRLATRFGLDAPNVLWESANPLDGMSGVRESGDFASCAKWGARTDDLMRDGTQVADCFPEASRDRVTLVVMTIGGNDIANIADAGANMTRTVPELWDQTRGFVQLLRDTIDWIMAPGRFPNGVFVILSNMFEFTDGSGDTASCPAAQLAGIGAPWDDPTALADMVIWANEQYLSIAVDYGVDMIFMLEHFCGHGHNADDPMAPCYRGPGSENWFDVSCIHPNPTGHGVIADMFMAVVNE